MWFYALILAWPAWCVLRALAGLGHKPAEPAKRIDFDPLPLPEPEPVKIENPYNYPPLR